MTKKPFIVAKCLLMTGINVLLFTSVKSQSISDLAFAAFANPADMNKYMQEYLRPYAEAQIYNSATGWYNTATTHHPLGFDVTASFKMAFIPTSKQTFLFRNSDFENLKLADNTITSAQVPTFLGNTSSQKITASNINTSFQAPSGIDYTFKDALHISSLAVPMPMLQVGVGILKHTDIKLRVCPPLTIGKVNVGLWGVGVQHNIGQYIPVFKRLPKVHLSVLTAFNRMNAKYSPSEKYSGIYGSINKSELRYGINSYTIQAIGSVKMGIAELYAGGGYFRGKSSIGYGFDYTLANNTSGSYSAPLDITYKNSGFTSTTGIKLHAAFFKIFADYTLATYQNLNFGIAYSMR